MKVPGQGAVTTANAVNIFDIVLFFFGCMWRLIEVVELVFGSGIVTNSGK